MGSWFSNIHIRKNGTATEETITKYISELLVAHQYLPCTSEVDADGAVAIIASKDCQWVSVYSDLLSLEDPKKCAEIAVPLSSQLHTDVLGISCFDSDYLYLNLINIEDKTDAWIGIGSASGLGIKRRSGMLAWKKKVSDFQALAEGVKKRYVFAEEFLTVAERCLELPAIQSSASYEYLKELELDEKTRYFYFRLPDEIKDKVPVKLVPCMYSGMPCFLDKPSVVDGINIGGESRGWESRKKIKAIDGTEEVLYQGVISQKTEIKGKFHELRKAIETGQRAFVLEDWERMKLLLDTIVFAFTKD